MSAILSHESTLLGAVDSYLKSLVHVRPHLARRFETVLEEMADQWLAGGRANWLAAVESSWLETYLHRATDRQIARQVIRDFYRWAGRQGLVEIDNAPGIVLEK